MPKDTFYFTHDYSVRANPKIKKLISKHGYLGYGIYWALIEDLYANTNVLPLDYDSIAFDLRTDTKVIESIICDFNLFVVDAKTFNCEGVQERLNIRNEKSIKARESVNKRWENTNVLPPNNEPNTNKGNESKGNKKKPNVKEDKESPLSLPFNSVVFISAWDRWKEYKKVQHRFTYKAISEQAALSELFEMSNQVESHAIHIINFSMAKGWKGLFYVEPPKPIVEGKKQMIVV